MSDSFNCYRASFRSTSSIASGFTYMVSTPLPGGKNLHFTIYQAEFIWQGCTKLAKKALTRKSVGSSQFITGSVGAGTHLLSSHYCAYCVPATAAGATCFFAYLYVRPLIRRGLGSASRRAPLATSFYRSCAAVCKLWDAASPVAELVKKHATDDVLIQHKAVMAPAGAT